MYGGHRKMTDYKYLDNYMQYNYDIEVLQTFNKSLWYAYVNGTITLEEYIRVKRLIASWIEDIEK